jgi:flagellar hook-associated protein 3 FlgL
MTYGQFMDVMNIIVTSSYPPNAPGTADEYDDAVSRANIQGNMDFTYDGKIEFTQNGVTNTKAQLNIIDATSANSPKTLTFMSNDALTITDPKMDMFKQLDEAIEAVKLKRLRPDANSDNPRNIGIQNGIQIIDDLSTHITKEHSKIGALSNSLNSSMQRSELLSVSTKTLRSSVLDTDIAEASLQLNQLSLNYQAMLSTIGRVEKLSLVNYL